MDRNLKLPLIVCTITKSKCVPNHSQTALSRRESLIYACEYHMQSLISNRECGVTVSDRFFTLQDSVLLFSLS